MKHHDRRFFLMQAGIVSSAMLIPTRTHAANEAITIGVIGCGQRGREALMTDIIRLQPVFRRVEFLLSSQEETGFFLRVRGTDIHISSTANQQVIHTLSPSRKQRNPMRAEKEGFRFNPIR